MQRRAIRVALMVVLFPLPLTLVVSAAVVVLTTCVKGWRQALEDCAMALAVLVALTAISGGGWVEIGLGAALTWLLAVLLGALRNALSLALAVQVAVLIGVVAAIGFTLWVRDTQAFWERVLMDLAERASSAGLAMEPADFVPGAAQLMTGMMSASAVMSSVVALLLGSAWGDPARGRDFGSEFRNLRMGRVLTLLAALLMVLLLTGLGSLADDLLLVLAAGFVLQGLALVHWHGHAREWPRIWPLALYLPMALLPIAAVLELMGLAVLGLLDNVFSLRRKGRDLA
ncbi:MAG: hypothetical protein H3C57_02725 [Gammaproteobacteria bacterium]|nr:hypothetical protein [Gammaproteobacteria bacterium]